MESENGVYTRDDDQDDCGNCRHRNADWNKERDKAGQEEEERSMKKEGDNIHDCM